MKEQKRDKDFDKRIIECIQKNYSFYAWQSLNGVIEKVEMKGKAFRAEYGEIELEVREGSSNQIKNIVSGSRKLSIYVQEIAMSFQAPLKSVVENGKVKINLPEDYIIHERRKHERLKLLKKCFVMFEIKSQVYKKAVYDVSNGGFAIILPRTERLIFPKDLAIISVELEFEGIKEKIKSKVICTSAFSFDRFKYKNLPYGGYKMAFCFKELEMSKKLILQEFILSELIFQSDCKQAN